MSEIKIKEEPIYSKVIGTYPDVDENNSAFTRLSFSLKHPITKEEIYYQLNKEDSKNIITENYQKKALRKIIVFIKDLIFLYF